ncbi:MAG: HDIG domain-containing protein [Bacteroidaceae bacterium]|nr:HDIG domain-containing protein [Bacteroidaceae bacterium]
MSRYNTPHRMSRAMMLYKIGITVATIALIVYFLPRERKYTYQFETGKPWRYGQLIATFDFPIYKNEATVKNEQDSALKQFHPYYKRENNVAQDKTKELEIHWGAEIKAGKTSPNARYQSYIRQTLRQLYRQGIISSEDLKKLEEDNIKKIRLVENNIATIVDINELLTVKQAYERLVTGDSTEYSPSILRGYNLHEFLTPNIIYDKQKSEAAINELLAAIPWSSGMVVTGTKIIDRGEIVDERTYNILESLCKETDKRSETTTQKRLTLGGQILFTTILIACFIFYLDLFRLDYYNRRRTILLLMGLLVFYPVITSLMVSHNLLNVYIIPFAMAPMIVRVFMDSRTAFMLHIVMILICSMTLRYPYEFILVQFIAGLTAVYSLRELSERSQLLKAALLVTLASMLLYFAYELMHTDDLTKLDTNMYIYLTIGGILLLFTYPLLFMLEKTFGFTSNVTLVELSNINTPLLRRMSEVAPGTFQHSLQVANLATEAARTVGARSQLVRTGALYHDIGKIENPAFFTENQSGVNPHQSLTEQESAQIIIGHVTDGLKLAEKYALPGVIKDFIATHHGVGMVKYFYISYLNNHPDEEIDKQQFTYPGPNPSTLEEAILMMADAVEAASRSLPEYTEEAIAELIEKIIDGQTADGVFRQCPITFKDIESIKGVFKEKLKTVYHTRISYPEIKKK